MPDTANYPDILGLMTNSIRASVGVIDLALVTRPRIVKAGRTFELLVVVQNTIDADVDVTVSLALPTLDAQRQRDRFVAKTGRLVIGVKPAETGVVVLPITPMADTAPAEAYRIGVTVSVKALAKGRRIRQTTPIPFTLDQMLPDARARVEPFTGLSYGAEKRGDRIETTFSLMSSAGLTQMADLKPGWISLCEPSDWQDARYLLHQLSGIIQVELLPRLRREALLPPLIAATAERFAAVGCHLDAAEVSAIARLMTLILEYTAPRQSGHDNIAARFHSVESLLAHDPLAHAEAVTLPAWIAAFARLLAVDARIAQHPEVAIPKLVYDALLRDAIDHGFRIVHAATGEDFGEDADRLAYADSIIATLNAPDPPHPLSPERAYVPLIVGGLLAAPQMLLKGETVEQVLIAIGGSIDRRFGGADEALKLSLLLARRALDRTLQTIGYR